MEQIQLFEKITDYLEEGLLFVNCRQEIQLFNQKAKEITGIIYGKTASHPAGVIEDGDIVIIADNSMGEDDGNLSAGDLALINIRHPDIRKNDMLLGVGVYNNPEIKPVYKYLRGHQPNSEFSLETNYLGFQITANISEETKTLHINVNGTPYEMTFLKSAGHGVIIDVKSGQIKFFQAKGYTIRRESIGNILRGSPFTAKGFSGNEIEVIGSELKDIFEPGEFTDHIDTVLAGRENQVLNAFCDLNKRLALCSFYAVEGSDGKPSGALIKIRDLSELDQLLDDRNKIIEEVEKKNISFKPIHTDLPRNAFTNFVGSSYQMDEVKYLAYKASRTKFNVIITGESGTGKSHLAYEIHQLYDKSAPFVEVNCNAIAPSLFESELFGYVGGAFTGASSSGNAGYFERADGGTIFLDEIGELPPEIQVKLLYVLQSKKINRVGSSKPIPVNVRVIAATNRNLEKDVEEGGFRQDLYYRINVFPIAIPPLRERKSDICLLINKTLEKICSRYDVPPKQFSGEALRKIMNYDWPGNVRELENILERAIVLCESNIIYPEHISIKSEEGVLTMNQMMADAEARIIKRTLQQFNGDKVQTMKHLGISKSVFYEKLKKYHIQVQEK
ncbi:MAG: sigma 54-interacting transcriptional regulator [Eubacteriales bacterium]|nr:sigma 54-interacting transcriptional regulator [Eubacteriales bacterium]